MKIEKLILTASDAESNDYFGSAVGIDGNRLIVGAHSEGTCAYNAGKVYVYDWNADNSVYDEVTTIMPSDAKDNDYFGYSVAIQGNRVIVGALGEDSKYSKVYVYDWNEGNSVYDEITTITSSDTEDHGYFGSVVALDGNRLIIGASNVNSGKVYVYDWNADKSVYDKVTTITALAEDKTILGISVALEGNRLIIGASTLNTGKVYVYDWNEDNSVYDKVTAITQSEVEFSDSFGYSVSLKRNILIIGAYAEDEYSYRGKVYVYKWNEDNSSYVEVETLMSRDPLSSDFFGVSTAINENSLIIGGYADDSLGTNAGKVYVYSHNFFDISDD